MLRTPILVAALFVSAFLVVASPVVVSSDNANSTVIDLEKRANQVTHVGRGTWFHVGLGNCGNFDNDNDPIVAIPKSLYDANGGENCDQWIEVTDTMNGKVAHGRTRDSCPSCGPDDLDLSPSLFEQFKPLSVGVLQISWNFKAKDWSP